MTDPAGYVSFRYDEREVLMSKMKNYMMDIEEFCDGYAFGGDEYDFDEVAAAATKTFGAAMAGAFAKDYLKRTYGE